MWFLLHQPYLVPPSASPPIVTAWTFVRAGFSSIFSKSVASSTVSSPPPPSPCTFTWHGSSPISIICIILQFHLNPGVLPMDYLAGPHDMETSSQVQGNHVILTNQAEPLDIGVLRPRKGMVRSEQC
eukprot:jgi/Botrbrau1/11546/Bobra.60_1s0001.1